MNSLISTYLEDLKKEMRGLDPATIRDALADTEEHLRTALADRREENPDLDEALALQTILEEYGSPIETAAAYAEVERRTLPVLYRPASPSARSPLARFFGVFTNPKAWGALLYMLISLLTGLFYFTWVVTGLSLSISLVIFIFGLPLLLGFLISVRGISLLDGRLVEALLGVRMPRRPLFASQEGKWYQRLKALLMDKHTWSSMLYLVLQGLLGTLYFSILVTMLALSLAGFAIPIIQLVFHEPTLSFGNSQYFLPTAALPLPVLAGFLLLTLTLHLANGIGQLHGKYAKHVLVGE
jgi:uncharacterized membrane protein